MTLSTSDSTQYMIEVHRDTRKKHTKLFTISHHYNSDLPYTYYNNLHFKRKKSKFMRQYLS